jgi:P pilus assembly chaperone PapD
MTGRVRIACPFVLGLLALVQPISAARAGIVLSELIVDLQPGRYNRDDVEIWNNGAERTYVAVEPREILDAGKPGESAFEAPDPEKLGLLVAPARMILEPGQRKLMRIARLASSGDRERVYRVTVKPVAGPLASDTSGLKLLVGYDVLVLARPAAPRPSLTGQRSGNRLTLRNDGNVSVELTQGRQCDGPDSCRDLPGKRLYAGAEWTETLPGGGAVEYLVRSPERQERRRF